MLRSYRELKVWKRSMVLVTDVYRISRSFPPDERFGLTSQLRRAAVSITTNIAEGYGRATRGEYLNHLSVARGSLFEVEALITVSAELSFLTKEELSTLQDHLIQMRAMLRALRNSLTRLTKKSGP
jgi:four helix bundle protein